MTRAEAVERLKSIKSLVDKYDDVVALREAVKALEQEPCEDAISRQAVLDEIISRLGISGEKYLLESERYIYQIIKDQPPVTPKQRTGHCKDCKYFEYDSVAKVDRIPLIVAHEICKRWGDGCKTSENGYCFLFEPQESEEQE